MIDELEKKLQKELKSLQRLQTQPAKVQKPKMKRQKSLISQKSNSRSISNLTNSFIHNQSISPHRVDEQCSFRPMLLRKSLHMAEKLGDPQDRLLKQKQNRDNSPQYQFKPKINKYHNMSHQQEKSNIPINFYELVPRWEQLYKLNKQREQRKAQQSDENLCESEQNTFKPDTSLSQNSYQGEYTLPFVERSKLWVSKKEQKLQSQKNQLVNDEIQQCTFKPKFAVRNPNNVSQQNISPFTRKGFIEFFERQEQANKKKQEQQDLEQKQMNFFQFNARIIKGQGWKNRITKPKEFNLQTKQRSKQRQPYNSGKENSLSNVNSYRLQQTELQQLHNELHNWNF